MSILIFFCVLRLSSHKINAKFRAISNSMRGCNAAKNRTAPRPKAFTGTAAAHTSPAALRVYVPMVFSGWCVIALVYEMGWGLGIAFIGLY